MRNFGKQCHSSYNRSPADTKGRGRPQTRKAVAPGQMAPGTPPHRRPRQPGPLNVARNSLATTSNFEVTPLELQRFQTLLNLHTIELHAKFWKTVPQLIQQVARRHERPRLPARLGDLASLCAAPRSPPAPRARQPRGHPLIDEHVRQSPPMSHVIPSRLLQILKSHCWNCNVSSDY